MKFKCTSCQLDSSVMIAQCPSCGNLNSFTTIYEEGEQARAYRPPGSPPLEQPARVATPMGAETRGTRSTDRPDLMVEATVPAREKSEVVFYVQRPLRLRKLTALGPLDSILLIGLRLGEQEQLLEPLELELISGEALPGAFPVVEPGQSIVATLANGTEEPVTLWLRIDGDELVESVVE